MCGVTAATIFDRTLAMKTENVGHHEATQALVLSVAGVMASMLIASFDFDDPLLSAVAARNSRKR
jgi:hypothetical protein